MIRLHSARLALPVLLAMSGACAAAPLSALPKQHAAMSPLQLTQATVEIIAPSAPPPLREETIPPPPSQTVVWQPGYWQWSDNQWVWVGGHYEPRPAPSASWEPGHWIQQPNGWLWVEGHWVSGNG